MTPRRRSLVDRAVRALVRLLPADFRSDFGDAIEASVDDRRRAGDRAGVWRRELPSLAAAIVREHASALRQDAAYAWRLMRRTPGFTVLAVVMLALGTGVNVAMFSVVDAVLLRSPFDDPDRIVGLRIGEPGRLTAAIPRERLAELTVSPGPLETVAGMTGGTHIVTLAGEPRSIDVECVSATMFDVLGTRPWLGRAFEASEDRAGAAPAVVLSYPFWRELGGSPSIVGSALTINRTPATVVGVMPRGFAGALSRSDVAVWLPLDRPIEGDGARGCAGTSTVNVYGRLRDGMTVDGANASIPGVRVGPLWNIGEDYRPAFLVLTVAVGCVLLIACINVGGLQMERMLARRREMAVRLALGCSRGRLLRQTLTENLLLALLGAAAGVVATWFALQAIVSLLPSNLPHVAEIAIDIRALSVALLAAAVAGSIAGLLPIGETRRFNPGSDLKEGTRASESRSGWTRRGLVIVEIALSIVVLIGAALMIQTFLTLRPDSPGFEHERKLVTAVRIPPAPPESNEAFFGRLLDRLRSSPGVRGVVGSTYLPMSGNIRVAAVTVGETTANVWAGYPTPGYFELMRIPLVAGRTFTPDDSSGAVPVAIVNDMFARRIRPDGHAVGAVIAVNNPARPKDPPIERRIVGVVANTRSNGLDTRVRNEVYVPYFQERGSMLNLIVETDGRSDAVVSAAIRATVRELRPDLPVPPVESLTSRLNARVTQPRFGAWLLGIFAALAVGLAAMGLMTTIGWWVRQRTRELGVRIALGATRGQVMRLVVGQGLALGAGGIAAGCLAALWLTRYLEGWIYGVTPLDPRTFVGSALAMLAVAAAAIYVPVRRATAVDPLAALRAE